MHALLLVPVAAALALSPLKRAISELEAADPARQVVAARTLGRLGDKQAVDPLLKMLDVRRDTPRLSAAIVTSLGELGDPKALDGLMGAWDYLNSAKLQLSGELPANLAALRATITEAVGRIGTERSWPLLEDALYDKDPQVVQKAIWGLGHAKDKRAAEALTKMLPAPAAFEALAEIGGSRAALEGYLKAEDPGTRVLSANALGNKDLLEAMVKDNRLETAPRLSAAYFLAKDGDRTGFEYLARLADKGKPGERARAIEALGKTGQAKAVSPVLEVAYDSDAAIRMQAAGALGRLGGSKAVNALRRLLEDRNPTVKNAARQALADLGQEF